MTSVERILRILKHQPVDRIGLFEIFWRETARKWSAEGHFAQPEMVSDHFGLDLRRTSGEITPLPWSLTNLVADIDTGPVTVEETETTKLVRDGNGALLRWWKNNSGAAEHVDFLVRDRKGWEQHIRPRISDESTWPRRLDFGRYRELRAKYARQNLCFFAGVGGCFDLMSPMCGHEHLLMGMAEDPGWVLEMTNLYADITVRLLEILFQREGLPNGLWVWDDLGFKARPFMSPAMYRELVFPGHKRVFDFAHSRGLPVLLHCDGFVVPLLPHLIEAGVDVLQPMEAKAGMDLVAMKKAYGDRLAFVGGMDTRVLETNDRAAVKRELESKIPAAMAGSGYILQVDHSVPPSVNYETYRYFMEEGLKLGTYH